MGSGPTADGRAIGFRLADIVINQRRRLNWIVKTTLVKVNATGERVKMLDRKVDHIATRNFEDGPYGRQQFHVSMKLANYRVDITFEKRSGENLGSYSEYFRVMKPRYQAVMTLSDEDAVPGQTIQARIENLGTEPVKAEKKLAVETYDGQRWSKLAIVYEKGKRAEGRVNVFGGETGPCFTYKVPVELSSGRYRVTEGIRRSLRQGQQTQASASFQVGPAQ